MRYKRNKLSHIHLRKVILMKVYLFILFFKSIVFFLTKHLNNLLKNIINIPLIFKFNSFNSEESIITSKSTTSFVHHSLSKPLQVKKS
jgi:hypothetical protein